MHSRRLIRRGQSTLEYAIIISMVIAGLALMGLIWFRAAYQGRLKGASDDIGDQFDTKYTRSEYTTNRTSNTTENLTSTGISVLTEEDITRTGNEVTDDLTARGQ